MSAPLELAYLQVEVPEPDTLVPFLADVIGLVPDDLTTAGELTWSDDDAAQRLVVNAAPRNDLAALGFEADDPATFESTLATSRSPRRRDDRGRPHRHRRAPSPTTVTLG